MTEDYQKKNRRYGAIFTFLYIVIFFTWLFIMYYRFNNNTYEGSFVVTKYLVDGVKITQDQVTRSFGLTFVDFLVKFNMLFFSGILGTTFVLYSILPKLKHLNYILLISAFIAAYIPSIFSMINFIINWQNNHYITITEFLILILLYPLNYAVFFFFFYILETFIFNRNKAS